jgi:uncharacterized membrane protein
MRELLQHERAARRVSRAFALMLVFAVAGCQDAAAPTQVLPTVDAPLAAELSATGWDLKLLPQLPDDGNVFGPDRRAEALAINDHGTIVGYGQRSYFLADSTAPCEGLSAFVYRKGVMIDPFARLAGTCLWNSVATDVNNRDEVVGWALDASGSKLAWTWNVQDGVRLLYAPGYDVIAFAINDAGTAVGYSEDAISVRPVAWTAAGYAYLPAPGAFLGRALDINSAGAIVGVVDNVVTQWLPDGSIVTGGSFSYGGRTAPFTIPRPTIGLNDPGMVVFNGYTTAGLVRAFAWDSPSETPHRLDAPPRVVSDVSDLQRIVGYNVVAPAPGLAVPYTTKAGTTTPLAIPSGFAEAWPNGVNRCGQVVGSARVGTTYRAVTWRQRGCD